MLAIKRQSETALITRAMEPVRECHRPSAGLGNNQVFDEAMIDS